VVMVLVMVLIVGHLTVGGATVGMVLMHAGVHTGPKETSLVSSLTAALLCELAALTAMICTAFTSVRMLQWHCSYAASYSGELAL
jgi:hypothetical protein